MRILFLLAIGLALFSCETKNKTEDKDTEQQVTSVDTFAWEMFILADSSFLEGEEITEDAMIEYEIEMPFFTAASADFNKMVNDSLYAVAGDLATIVNGDYKAAYKRDIATAIEEYHANAADEDNVDIDLSFYRRYYFSGGKVVLNKKNILTVDVAQYVYEGGAHGNGSSSYYSFTNKPVRYLGYEQIIASPEDAGPVTALLNEYIKDREMLYEPTDTVPVTNNVGLTEEGVLFCYPPYHIGPYAAGTIEIVLPYERLKKEGLLSADVAKLVAEL